MGSKKSHRYLARLFRRTPKKEFFKIVVLQGICLVGSYFYWLSLEGGDVDYLISIVGYLSFALIGSLSLNIFVAVCNWYTCTGWVRAFNLVSQFIILSLTLTHDLGTDIMQHGQYNVLIYFLLCLPIILFLATYKTCKYFKHLVRSWKWWIVCRFVLLNLIGLICSYFFIEYSIKSADENWYLGLEGKLLDKSWPKCSLDPPGLPWPGMLPHRTLNFFSIF